MADMLCIEQLKISIEQHIVQTMLSEGNVIRFWNYLHIFRPDASNLLLLCKGFVLKNLSTVSETPEFCQLDRTLVTDALRSSSPQTDDALSMKTVALTRWFAKNDPESLKRQLSSVMSKISLSSAAKRPKLAEGD
jgi:hypothetical protein